MPDTASTPPPSPPARARHRTAAPGPGLPAAPADDSVEPIAPAAAGSGYLPRQLVLVGAGWAHLQLLLELARKPLVGARITLITPHASVLPPSLVAAFAAGQYSLQDCSIALEPLVRRAGIRWLTRNVQLMDAHTCKLHLDDGTSMQYDWLSVNTDAVQFTRSNLALLPGAREHGLWLRPVERFATQWAKVAALGQHTALRIAVVGAGSLGVEMALAVRHRLPKASVTLLTGGAPLACNYPPLARARLLAALQARGITVLHERATALDADAVQLASGATLACHLPLVATGGVAPQWLQDSGLALDADGAVAVNALQRSTSHANVFAIGEASARPDVHAAARDALDRRGAQALLRNLHAVVGKRPPTPFQRFHIPLRVVGLGGGRAMAAWGFFSVTGWWVGWLKRWAELRLLARYRSPQ
jgi:NADH dehydrogenase FAD-containing subunit